MSFKAKNLSYEAQEPAFLRRLRSQHGGVDSDRHERPIARPRRAKDPDDDDGPTYVDEETNNNLSKEEYEAMVAGEAAEPTISAPTIVSQTKSDNVVEPEVMVEESSRAKQDVTEIGKIQKKRKMAKVVGADVEPENDAVQPPGPKKLKKKSKPVKLSFGVDE